MKPLTGEWIAKASNLFLLGAGFTKAVFPDAPLNKDLLPMLCKGSSRTTLKKYYREHKTDDIEILLTRLDLEILRPNHKQTALQQVRKKIERQLAEYFVKFRFKKEIIANSTWLKDFANLFQPNDAIISLNYDCLLEGVLDYYEVWSPNGGYVNVENPLLDSPTNANNILIYKIHGSENFWEASPFGKNGPKKEQRCIGLVVNESIFPRSGQSRIFGYGGGQPEVRQYIIAPSFVKFPLMEMANMVNKLIPVARNAKSLVIGGCGLRREDMSLWLILASFLNRRLQSTKKLIIIDPSQCDQIKARIANYWTGATDHFTICCIHKTFQDGIKQLISELKGSETQKRI